MALASLANDWRGHLDLRGTGGAFEPKNVNLYAYSAQNPLRFIDVDGREYICSQEPNCVPRENWARYIPNFSLMDPQNVPIMMITLHHTASEKTPYEVEELQRGHKNTFWRYVGAMLGQAQIYKNWGDVGYHFLVDEDGRVYAARSMLYQGAHVLHHDPGNLGIAVLGDYTNKPLNQKQLDAIKHIISETRKTSPNAFVWTHGDFDRSKHDELKGAWSQILPLRVPPPPQQSPP